MPRSLRHTYYLNRTLARDLCFADQEHGRTAPAYLRKHCGECGVTLPNRSRSWICARCYQAYRTRMSRLAAQRRRVVANSRAYEAR